MKSWVSWIEYFSITDQVCLNFIERKKSPSSDFLISVFAKHFLGLAFARWIVYRCSLMYVLPMDGVIEICLETAKSYVQRSQDQCKCKCCPRDFSQHFYSTTAVSFNYLSIRNANWRQQNMKYSWKELKTEISKSYIADFRFVGGIPTPPPNGSLRTFCS